MVKVNQDDRQKKPLSLLQSNASSSHSIVTGLMASLEECDHGYRAYLVLYGSFKTANYKQYTQRKFGFFQKAEEQSKVLLKSASSSVTDTNSPVIGVFNTLSWNRGGLVYLPADQSIAFNSVIDEKGETVPSQRLSTGELVFPVNDVPALGSKKYFLKEKKSKIKGTIAQQNILDNGIVRVVIDAQTGDISSLTSGTTEFVDSKTDTHVNSYRYLHGDDNQDKATGTKSVKINIKEN